MKEEKLGNPVGPDPGGGGPGSNLQDDQVPTPGKQQQQQQNLADDLMLNGAEIKLERSSSPQLHDPNNKGLGDPHSDIPPLPDLHHSDFPDCEFTFIFYLKY